MGFAQLFMGFAQLFMGFAHLFMGFAHLFTGFAARTPSNLRRYAPVKKPLTTVYFGGELSAGEGVAGAAG